MMRSCRVAVAALSCLVSFATSAHAECAWILWTQQNRDSPWVPSVVFNSRAECEQSAERSARFWIEYRQKYPDKVGRGTPEVNCFPDTIDPRGPKTK